MALKFLASATGETGRLQGERGSAVGMGVASGV